jgi:hypothetical protein
MSFFRDFEKLEVVSARFDPSLSFYWPFVNNSSHDIVSGMHLNSAVFLFVTDRHNLSKSAIRVNVSDGFFKAPSAVYFTGDFTITGWLKRNDKTEHRQR